MTLDFETVAGGLILLFFCWVIWRGGKNNPVGTGQLQSQLNTIGAQVKNLGTRVDGCALTADVEKLRGELKEMEARVASSGEVLALEGQIAAINARMGGMEKLVERTDGGVQRLESYFLARGVNGR